MRQRLYQSYIESETAAAEPLKLVCLLYRRAIEQVGEARACLRREDIAGRCKAISRAIGVVHELVISLDHERGGEISRNLLSLYDYMLRRINEANFNQTEEPLAEVEQLLRTLGNAWEECRASETSQADEYESVSCAG